MTYYELDPSHANSSRIRKERERAQKLKKSQWWLTIKNTGKCHYCGTTVKPSEITMDHVIPIARGGSSTKNNCVPSCKSCNQSKGLHTPVDLILNPKNER